MPAVTDIPIMHQATRRALGGRLSNVKPDAVIAFVQLSLSLCGLLANQPLARSGNLLPVLGDADDGESQIGKVGARWVSDQCVILNARLQEVGQINYGAAD